MSCTRPDALPVTASGWTVSGGIEEGAIERREICVGSSIKSAGDLGETLYYRASMLPDGKLVVGYFAFFSEERPWGNNWLTWTVFPALAVDMVYSHGLLVGAGMQRAMSGKGDVEGFRVVYELRPDGTLQVESAIADNGTHDVVKLTASDVLMIDAERPTFYSDVWSHQLGGRGVRNKSDLAYVRCYGKGSIRALSDEIAEDFAVDGRAPPAHVEALGGRLLGAPITAEAKAKAKAVRAPM
jgi:hypothetical protein